MYVFWVILALLAAGFVNAVAHLLLFPITGLIVCGLIGILLGYSIQGKLKSG